jgi:hypothetical protein
MPINSFNTAAIQNGVWLAILHAQRIPPHIGIIFSGKYNSLTIKENEFNINSELIFKTIEQKKIKSLFLKVNPHPVFSIDHQSDIFHEHLKKFPSVKQNESTCLTPIKLFFEEFYAIPNQKDELLFEFIQKLNDQKYIEYASSCQVSLHDGIELPYYSAEELNNRIKAERQTYYNE